VQQMQKVARRSGRGIADAHADLAPTDADT
jgi:hypothetical protein